MPLLDTKIPDYLTTKKALISQVLFTAFFALVFINMYAPFGVDTWYTTNQMQLLAYSSMVILLGMLIIVISRILMYLYCRKTDLNYLNYSLWIAGEILALALVYALLEAILLHDERDFLTLTKLVLKYTALVVLLPYAIYWLYLSWKEKKDRLEALGRDEGKTQRPLMVPFLDEKNILRLSVKQSELLYLEAADNYVLVFYRDGQKLARYMVRNRMKKMEEQLQDYHIVRCHRSFLVNMDRVKLIRREKEGLYLELEGPENKRLPVSGTYSRNILSQFAAL